MSLPFDWTKAHRELPLSDLCALHALPQDRPPRLVSAMPFSPTLQKSFSGSTYHLARAGLLNGTLEGCFGLYSGERPLRALQARGALWKLQRGLLRQKTSGFKFTSAYLDTVWPRYIQALAGSTIINNFQMFGPAFWKRRRQLDIGAYFYIDGTLAEYFEDYAGFEVDAIDAATQKRSMEVERDDYQAADFIVAMSRATGRNLVERYGVPAEKISIVVPGANLLDREADAFPSGTRAVEADDFVLGFTGEYPERKGLNKLVDAVTILRGRGLRIRLRVIGKCPVDIRNKDGVEYAGHFDKRVNLAGFMQAIGTVHLGCLLSRAELTGIAMVEFLRLGVPVIGTKVGGLTDILEGGGSIGVAGDVSVEELAETIGSLYHNQDRYQKLKLEAEARRPWASWRRAAKQLDTLIP